MNRNLLQWDGKPGHYEVWYLTMTDPVTGIGFWVRYTVVAPINGDATCSIWFICMDPADPASNIGEKKTYPISDFTGKSDPFEVKVGPCTLSDFGAKGELESDRGTLSWDLEWKPDLPAYGHVHPVLQRLKIAKTVLYLPHADLEMSGRVSIGGRDIALERVKGGQAHLWGSKHASRWAWAHCNDLVDDSGRARTDFIDGVSVFVPRFGRELGPNTPVVARIGGEDLAFINPIQVMRAKSDFDLTSWSFECKGLTRKVVGNVAARKDDLVGVTYHDPDGELAYCYNTEVANMDLELYRRSTPFAGWRLYQRLKSDGRAHFEYAQRDPIDGVELFTT